MKKIVSLLLVVLTLAAVAAPALADDTWTCSNGHTGQTGKFCGECGAPRPVSQAERACTQAFLDELDARSVTYEYRGVDSDGDEGVLVQFTGDNAPTIDVYCYFTSDEELCFMRVWNFIDYDAAFFSSVLVAINNLNTSYRYVKFNADTSDDSITVAADMILRSAEDIGEICVEGLSHIIQIADLGYPDLAKFAVK